jgi:hypothetical protein
VSFPGRGQVDTLRRVWEAVLRRTGLSQRCY